MLTRVSLCTAHVGRSLVADIAEEVEVIMLTLSIIHKPSSREHPTVMQGRDNSRRMTC
jgi:hypothetical protein